MQGMPPLLEVADRAAPNPGPFRQFFLSPIHQRPTGSAGRWRQKGKVNREFNHNG
jgi:hypothetical protein